MAGWGAKIAGAAALKKQFGSFQDKLQGPVVYSVGTPVEYSVYVELGTSRMAARPYLEPAVREVERNIQDIFNNAGSLSAAVAETALEIEREAKRICPFKTGNLRASIKAERIQ